MRSDRCCSPPPPRSDFAAFGARVSLPIAPVPTPLSVRDEAELHARIVEAHSRARLQAALREVGIELGRRVTVRA